MQTQGGTCQPTERNPADLSIQTQVLLALGPSTIWKQCIQQLSVWILKHILIVSTPNALFYIYSSSPDQPKPTTATWTNCRGVHVEVVKSSIHCLHLRMDTSGKKWICESPTQMLQTIKLWEYRGICGWNCCHKSGILQCFKGNHLAVTMPSVSHLEGKWTNSYFFFILWISFTEG